MSISFFDASIQSYTQVLSAVSNVLNKGASHASEQGIDTQEYVTARLREDMMPLHFQVVSVVHHSLGAINAMQSGTFAPPSFELDMSYAELTQSVTDACDKLNGFSADEINDLADGSLIFKLGSKEIPFTNQNFLLSFSLPNFYFHATTTYGILRMLGVPVGKGDYLGQMKIG